ncbi:MAG: hypothetical protein AAF652_15085 [Cyanobacteria bacterium P01_C01_bin.72]
MADFLIVRLVRSSLLCILVLLPCYYLLGYSVLNAIACCWHQRFNQSQDVKFEDILISALATLALILIGCKVVGVFPQLQLIWFLSTVISIVCLVGSWVHSRFSGVRSIIKLPLPVPNWRSLLLGLLLFTIYLVHTLVKARSLANAQYIPSRFNTDIFLYIRRSIVFLGDKAQIQLENGQPIIDILYNSPKLLSTLIYSSFTYVSGDIGVAATIITSLVLTAIALKYLTLIKTASGFDSASTTLALAMLIIFQPVWCWLQDQFYWSNLLCIYLLIYALEDLILARQIKSNYLGKLAIALTALAGFYPSQLPFFMVAAMAGIMFHPGLAAKSRYRYLLSIFIMTMAIACLFFTQYLATGEVFQHFNLADAKHGQNLNYIPFWSLLDYTPRTGGTPKDLGAILLISASLIVGLFVVRYCTKTIPTAANWFRLLYALYTLYSISYLVLPGEYRQSKFFFTYIVPLIVFCLLRVVLQTSLSNKPVFKILFAVLAIYVAIKSWLKPYKPHVSREISTAIATVQSLNKPTLIYMYEGSIAHGYYYFASQLKNLDFELISGCPEASAQNQIKPKQQTIVVDTACPQITDNPNLQSSVIYTDINGDDID